MKKHSAMKKLATLLLAAALTVGAVQQRAAAADMRVSGIWDFNFEWNNISFSKDATDDRFHARQRLRTQVELIASETLKGVVFFEIGSTHWGRADQGGSLGTDATNIKVRYSYVDWVVPNTELKVRMGLQPYALPSFVAGSPILDDADGAGITLNYQFNETVGLTAFWLRAEHDNAYDDGDPIQRGLGDNMDFFGLSLPLTGEGWALTPWGVYGNVGRNSLIDPDEGGAYSDVLAGMMPYGVPGAAGAFLNDTYNPAWWVGFGGELTLFDPFRIALDVSYGKVDWGSIDFGARDLDLTREGWLAIASVDYKFDRVTPGLVFWYGSGDDDDPFNGSERMPTIKPSWTATTFGYDDGWGIADCDVMGLSPVGTWGVIGRLADISFMEDLSHTLRVGYYTGTNDEDAVKNGAGLQFGGAFTDGPVYLTKKDHALEVNFDSEYKIYENLTFALELGYIHLDLDEGVWNNVIDTDNLNKNVWKAGLNLRYAF